MPRASRVPAVLVNYRPSNRPRHAPRLWNAKKRIQTNVGVQAGEFESLRVSPHELFTNLVESSKLKDRELLKKRWAKFITAEPAEGIKWWQNEDRGAVETYMTTHPVLAKVSKDVRDFVIRNPQLEESQILSLLRSPKDFFKYPKNVPLDDRKQVYFPHPRHSVLLLRTPHLGPRYAAFEVPLHFNKLDIRSYLKNLYNVDVLHVRSTTTQGKLVSVDAGPGRRGRPVRQMARKKMTVLLTRPFVYPKEAEDLSPWERDQYWNSALAQSKYNTTLQPTKPNAAHREALKSQARIAAQQAVQDWTPTWRELTDNLRAMEGSVTAAPQPIPPPTSSQRSRNKNKKNEFQPLRQALPTR